jgi:hypothetical protein
MGTRAGEVLCVFQSDRLPVEDGVIYEMEGDIIKRRTREAEKRCEL